MRILLADDHVIVRKGLKEILAHEFPDASFGEAGNVPEAIAQLRSGHWDVLVLDVSMPGGTGLDVLGYARQTRAELPVIVLSMYSADQYAERVLAAGAAAYLTKETAPAELVETIRKLTAGREGGPPAT